MKLMIIKFLKNECLVVRLNEIIEYIKVKSESNKIFSNIGKFNCEIVRLTKLILRKILNVEKIVILKILKIGGLIVRERGYVCKPPASKLKHRTPPSTSHSKSKNFSQSNQKRFCDRRTIV